MTNRIYTFFASFLSFKSFIFFIFLFSQSTFARSLELVDRSLDYKLKLLEKTREIENPIEKQKLIDDILGWRSAKQYFQTARLCSYRALAPNILIDGWLWSADYFGRISPDGKSQEIFYFHNGNELFLPKVFMQAGEIGNKKYVLAADQRQMWIFKMDNH